MSVKYSLIKGMFRLLNFQKIMTQPYEKLQKTFHTADTVPNIPTLHHQNFDFETITVCGQPVLNVKHKAKTDKVCVYVVGGGMLKYPKPKQAKGQINLARKTGRDIFLPYYPLVPQHLLWDVYAMLYELYKELLKTYKGGQHRIFRRFIRRKPYAGTNFLY